MIKLKYRLDTKRYLLKIGFLDFINIRKIKHFYKNFNHLHKSLRFFQNLKALVRLCYEHYLFKLILITHKIIVLSTTILIPFLILYTFLNRLLDNYNPNCHQYQVLYLSKNHHPHIFILIFLFLIYQSFHIFYLKVF